MFDGEQNNISVNVHEIVEYYCISRTDRERKESISRFRKENNTRSHNSNLRILDERSKSLPSYSFCGNMQATHDNMPENHSNMQGIHGNMQGIHGNMQGIHGNVQGIHGNVQPIHGNVQAIHGHMQAIHAYNDWHMHLFDRMVSTT